MRVIDVIFGRQTKANVRGSEEGALILSEQLYLFELNGGTLGKQEIFKLAMINELRFGNSPNLHNASSPQAPSGEHLRLQVGFRAKRETLLCSQNGSRMHISWRIKPCGRSQGTGLLFGTAGKTRRDDFPGGEPNLFFPLHVHSGAQVLIALLGHGN